MKLQSINPATEEVLKEFEALDFGEAKAGVEACRAAQRVWRRESVATRAGFLKKLAAALRTNLEDCARLATLEMGKPVVQARAEVEKCAMMCEFYADNAATILGDEPVITEAKKSYVRFDPLGVVFVIMPWNFPFWQVFRCAGPAITAGNGVVLKHASNVPQCALKIEELFRAAGYPEGLFKTLLIDSKTSGALIEADIVDAVSLTGSTQAGAVVAAQAGAHLKKCVLELGGSDPFIVLADADIAAAAAVAVQARMQNNGQSCIAAKRFIVEKPAAAAFEAAVVEAFKKLKIGDPLLPETNIGPLAKADIRDGIEVQVNDAVAKGARVLAGGKKAQGKGFFFQPTLLADVTPAMKVYTEEVFGPVMSLITVQDKNEAVRISNESEFGLGASVWTRNIALAEDMAREIESGFVAINGMPKSDPRLPFGGVKKSGFGRELGSYGMKEFVNVKTVVVN